MLFQQPDGLGSKLTVGLVLIATLCGKPSTPFDSTTGKISAFAPLAEFRSFRVNYCVPRFGIIRVFTSMEDFSQASREVSILAKQLGQGNDIRQFRPEGGCVVQDAGRIGPQPGEKGRPTRVANGVLTVSAVKTNAARCQFVNIGGFDYGMAVAAQSVIKIVNNDKQHVSLVPMASSLRAL